MLCVGVGWGAFGLCFVLLALRALAIKRRRKRDDERIESAMWYS